MSLLAQDKMTTEERFTSPQEIKARYDKAHKIANESALKNFFRATIRVVRPSDQREASSGNLETAERVARGYSEKYLPALEDMSAAEARVAGKNINLPH